MDAKLLICSAWEIARGDRAGYGSPVWQVEDGVVLSMESLMDVMSVSGLLSLRVHVPK